MNQAAIKLWLGRKRNLGFAQHVLLGALALLAGIVVLFLTFWFTYAIIWFGWHGVTAVSELIFSKKLHLSHTARLVGSGVFVVLLFVQHFRTSPFYWGEYPDEDYVSAPTLQMHAHDRLERRRLAGAIAAEQRHYLAGRHIKRDAVQDVRLAVPCLQIANAEQRLGARGLRCR